jgi:hypothetical protein
MKYHLVLLGEAYERWITRKPKWYSTVLSLYIKHDNVQVCGRKSCNMFYSEPDAVGESDLVFQQKDGEEDSEQTM